MSSITCPSRAGVLNPGKTLSNFENFILISILYIKNTNKGDISVISLHVAYEYLLSAQKLTQQMVGEYLIFFQSNTRKKLNFVFSPI